MLKRLGKIPVRAAVTAMVLMLAFGVISGNRNALARARTPVIAQVLELRDRASSMAGKASNYIAIAQRLGVASDDVTLARNDVTSDVSRVGSDRNSANRLANDASALHLAILNLDGKIKSAIESLPANDPNRAVESAARASAYDDWMRTRMSYIDHMGYNSAVEALSKIYNGVPSRLIWSGYNYPRLSE